MLQNNKLTSLCAYEGIYDTNGFSTLIFQPSKNFTWLDLCHAEVGIWSNKRGPGDVDGLGQLPVDPAAALRPGVGVGDA